MVSGAHIMPRLHSIAYIWYLFVLSAFIYEFARKTYIKSNRFLNLMFVTTYTSFIKEYVIEDVYNNCAVVFSWNIITKVWCRIKKKFSETILIVCIFSKPSVLNIIQCSVGIPICSAIKWVMYAVRCLRGVTVTCRCPSICVTLAEQPAQSLSVL